MADIANDLRSSLLTLLEARSKYLLEEVNGNGDKLTIMPEWINHIYTALVPAKLFELNFHMKLFCDDEDSQYNVQGWYLRLLEPSIYIRMNEAFTVNKNQDTVLEICVDIKNYAYLSKGISAQDLS